MTATDLKPTAVYELRGVSKTYAIGGNHVHAVRDVDLAVDAGEAIAIAGPSGSGKTTLLQLLGALDKPSVGEIMFEGRDIGRMGDGELSRLRLRTFGFVFQQFNLIPTLTAAQNVEIALAPSGMSAADRREAVPRLLDSVGLGARSDHVPSKLSGGEQQRVAIARALANEPHVLLADEPTGNLDSASANDVLTILERMNEFGTTIVMVTHSAEVAEHASRIIRFADGQVVADEVVARPLAVRVAG